MPSLAKLSDINRLRILLHFKEQEISRHEKEDGNRTSRYNFRKE